MDLAAQLVDEMEIHASVLCYATLISSCILTH